MRKWMILLGTVLLLLPIKGFGQTPQTTGPVKALAETFVRNHAPDTTWTVGQIEKQNLSKNISVNIVRLHPAGFLILSPGAKESVLAFSFKNDFGNSEEVRSLLWPLLKSIFLQKPNPVPTKNALVEKTWGPYVYTMWGQVNCYDQNSNLINVTNYYTPHHYAAGCVAISMSTLMHYYRWPLVGSGSYTYTDNRGSSTGTYSATFSNAHYKWDQMLDRYKFKRSTTLQRKAAGQLVYHAAVSLSTDFEPNGSTSNVNRIPNAGRKYFRYDGVEKTPSSKTFWDMFDFNLAHRIPVILAIKNSTGGGHSVVCDGLKIDADGVYYYHLNMGWWGSSNGWYRLRDSWNVQGYNAITDGIFYFLPIPQLMVPHAAKGQKKVLVTWSYPAKVNVQAFELQQKIGSGSWKRLSDTITDTAYEVNVKSGVNQYFRVRAKVADRWPYNDWSNVERVTFDVTGIPSGSQKPANVVLSPNPASGTLHIRFGKYVPSQITVFNIYGRRVLQVDKVPEGAGYFLDISTLPDGYYFLQLTNGSHRLRTLKFIKR